MKYDKKEIKHDLQVCFKQMNELDAKNIANNEKIKMLENENYVYREAIAKLRRELAIATHEKYHYYNFALNTLNQISNAYENIRQDNKLIIDNNK